MQVWVWVRERMVCGHLEVIQLQLVNQPINKSEVAISSGTSKV